MKKKLSLLLVAFMGAFALTTTACKKETDVGNTIEVAGTYNTLKVHREGEYVDLGQRLDVAMVKNETEGAQLIVTPEKDVKSLVVNVSPLVLTTDNSVTIPTDDITVYFQKYVYVTSKTNKNQNENYPVGETPDMLLRQDLAVEYGENTATGGKRQGITVEFTTTKDTVAGEYTGLFTLVADGQTFDVPVTVKVYDITLGKANGQTAMLAGAQTNMTGEYDTTSESYRRYYETALREYKFCFEKLPNADNPVKMAENAVYYWNEEQFTSYNLPTRVSWNKEGAYLLLGEFYSYLWELAIRSKPEQILFDKAYCFASHIDEATAKSYPNVKRMMQQVVEVQEKIFADLEESGYFDEYDAEYKTAFEKSLKQIPIILTGDNNSAKNLGVGVHTYCSRIDGIQTEARRELFETIKEENEEWGSETWFYTCMEPAYPYPSHHIDDMLLGSRVMRWMQKDYNWDGYLYWQVFSYSMWTGNETLMVDPYTEPMRFPNINGDGYLAYPGKKYGEDTFLPSLRMTAFRDGQEDYDLLCLFEDILQEKADFYGVSDYDSQTYLNELYEALYSDPNNCYDDDANFYAVREKLFALIETHKSDTKFLLTHSVNGTTAINDIYLANGYTLSVNGTAQTGTPCGQGLKYTLTSDLTQGASKLDVEIFKNGERVERHTYTTAGKTVKVNLTEDNAPFTHTVGSSMVYTGTEAQITLQAFGDSESDIKYNKPTVWLTKGLTDVKVTDLQYVSFDIQNNGAEEITIYMFFGVERDSGGGSDELISYTIAPNEKITVKMNELFSYAGHYSRMSAKSLGFYVENYKTVDGEIVKLDDRVVTVSEMYYSYKGE